MGGWVGCWGVIVTPRPHGPQGWEVMGGGLWVGVGCDEWGGAMGEGMMGWGGSDGCPPPAARTILPKQRCRRTKGWQWWWMLVLQFLHLSPNLLFTVN